MKWVLLLLGVMGCAVPFAPNDPSMDGRWTGTSVFDVDLTLDEDNQRVTGT